MGLVDYNYLSGSDLLSSVSYQGSQITAQRVYENNRNLLESVNNAYGTNVISHFAYINDALGRRTDRQDSGSAFALAITNTFGYNLRSEVETAAMANGNSTYNYDPIGNRKQTVSPTSGTTDYLANQLNQYASISGAVTNAPVHDLDGNLLSDGNMIYVWNGENRNVTVTNGNTVVNNTYDYQGRRVRKLVEVSGGATKDLRYVYDGWNLIQESDVLNNTTNNFIWGLDLSQTMQGAGGVGGLLAVQKGTNNFAVTYDANGNISEYIDLSDGSITSHHEYDAFGQRTVASGNAPCSFGFSTKYLDAETELLYYGFRYYDPEKGRWLSRDRIGELGGKNLYGFVSNKPVLHIDLLGMVGILDTVDFPDIPILDAINGALDRLGTLEDLYNLMLGSGNMWTSTTWCEFESFVFTYDGDGCAAKDCSYKCYRQKCLVDGGGCDPKEYTTHRNREVGASERCPDEIDRQTLS